MTDIRTILRKKRLYFDGGTGTCLQRAGLPAGMPPALWSLERPEQVTALHRAYLDAGADIIKTNTFGVTQLQFGNDTELISAAVACARAAVAGRADKFVAFDIGPTGRLLKPLGDLAFEDAVSAYTRAVRAAVSAGADLILIETMNDTYETKAAVLAAKEVSDLPVFVTCAFDRNGKLMTGADVRATVALLEGLGVDALGMNCSFGPAQMLALIDLFTACSYLPLIVNPNAGLPRAQAGETVYDVSPREFAGYMRELAQRGACLLGGCCGTTPEYIAETVAATREIPLSLPTVKTATVVSSYTHAVEIGDDPVLIGERLNPTGKPKLKEALRSGDMDYLVGEGIREVGEGAALLDVNVGLPGLDEPSVLSGAVAAIQASVDAPLCLDSSSPPALEAAMRCYNGKPLVNSVNGKEESMAAVLPLVRRYGGVVIVLTMDENGIPDTAEGRVAIAERVAACAETYGIARRELIVDPLALTISAGAGSAGVTLRAITLLRERGFRVSLGVSNISFGLPSRELINSTFFAQTLAAGLSCAIMNPDSTPMTDVWNAHRALAGLDPACASYIAYAGARSGAVVAEKKPDSAATSLREAILRGRSAAAASAAAGSDRNPLDLIREEIVPALDEIGSAFEEKRAYLPQLLMSADAATAAFAEIKGKLPPKAEKGGQCVILATVRGDIHDIGKNIVRVLLESYGYKVHDLGRDVPPETVLSSVRESGCRLVGLSALMTTTVPAMEETIALLHREVPDVKIMVGGAVLTQDYAARIGADAYSADAMDAVRYTERFYGEI